MKEKFIEWFTAGNSGYAPAIDADGKFEKEKTQHMWEAYQAGLASAEAQVKQLAAENAALKSAIEFSEPWLPSCDDELLHRIKMAKETPATDTYAASLRAEGVEMFAESQKAYVRDNRNSLDAMNRAAYCGSALDAERFAAQLRSKSEVQ